VLLCRRLNEEHARYLVIGGFALAVHGFLRGTKDIDLLVDPSEENVRAIKRALSALPDNAASELADTDVAEYGVVRVADEVIVDLLARACGVDYAEATRDGVTLVQVEGVDIPVATPEVLIRTKDTWRPSDRIDVDFLTALIARRTS
jgi:hypothetical protein